MHKKTDLVILPDSPEAASEQTITGWVSRNGFFYGSNERLARYDGSTHSYCTTCKGIASKSYTLCDGCRDKEETIRWNKRELVEWDGETPFCLEDGDTYFHDVDEFFDWFDDASFDDETKPEDVRLLLCVPTLIKTLDVEDILGSDYETIEEFELPDEIAKALEALNVAIKANNKPLCWWPGKQRIIISREE